MTAVFVGNDFLVESGIHAAGRAEQNKGKPNASGYDHDGFDRLPFDDLQSNTFAIVGEVGGHLFFKVDPAGTQWVVKNEDYSTVGLKENADFKAVDADGKEWKVEVRNVTETWRPIPIKRKDNQDNVIVLQVYARPDVQMDNGKPVRGESVPTGWVEILAWQYGTEFKESLAKGDTYFCIKKNDPDTLKEMFGL